MTASVARPIRRKTKTKNQNIPYSFRNPDNLTIEQYNLLGKAFNILFYIDIYHQKYYNPEGQEPEHLLIYPPKSIYEILINYDGSTSEKNFIHDASVILNKANERLKITDGEWPKRYLKSIKKVKVKSRKYIEKLIARYEKDLEEYKKAERLAKEEAEKKE